MKQIVEYLLNKIKKPKLSNNKLSKTKNHERQLSKLESWENSWGVHYIPSEIMHQYIVDALEIERITPDDLLNEYSKFKDDEEWAEAYPDKVPIYRKFEDRLSEIILESRYSEKESYTLNIIWEKFYEIMTEIKETFENDTNK